MSKLVHYEQGCVYRDTASQLGWYERQELTKSSKQFDATTWWLAYREGYRKPNYPLPVTLADADKALSHLPLLSCPVRGDGFPCHPCIDKFMDAIEYHYLPE